MSYKDDLKLTLSELGSAFGPWRSQVFGLAKKDLSKKTKRSALGWFWLFFQPVVYISCFWFALYVGVKNAKNGLDGGAYLLWLSSGVIPWWFMKSCLNSGPKCLSKYKFLITQVKFPVALVPVFKVLSAFLFQLMLTACLIVGYFIGGGQLTIYFLQLPLVMLLMFVFFIGYSMLTSPLCAISSDVASFLTALTTPIFWLSGILFDVTTIHSQLIHTVLNINPVTFFVMGYRKVLSNTTTGWIWDDPVFFWCGITVIVITIVAGVLVFSKLRKGLADVL